MSLCPECREVRDLSYRVPRHLVHPGHGKPDTWDARGEQACPHCGARWRATSRNTFELVTL